MNSGCLPWACGPAPPRGTKASFTLTDYRDVEGRFDRIISVGMFEHVGVPNFDTYFAKIASLLADDGIAVIHS
ncbi:MAG: class I SAM-dependent methyltransferase, partial [Sphingomonas sp.]